MRTDRLNKIIAGMKAAGMDQIVITDPSTIFYLTGSFVAPGFRLLAILADTTGKSTMYVNALQTDYGKLWDNVVWYKDTQDPIQIMAESIPDGSVVGVDKN